MDAVGQERSGAGHSQNGIRSQGDGRQAPGFARTTAADAGPASEQRAGAKPIRAKNMGSGGKASEAEP